MPIEIVPAEAIDICRISEVFCDAFFDQSHGPYGPGGYYMSIIWPGLGQPDGRARAFKRLQRIFDATHVSDPSWWLKAVDTEQDNLIGAFKYLRAGMLICCKDEEKPSYDAVAAPPFNADFFETRMDYEVADQLRQERNALCWRTAQILPTAPLITIVILAVSPNNQKRGAGSMLIEAAVARAKRRKASMFVLAIPSSFAIRSYEKAGFVIAEDRELPQGTNGPLSGIPKTRLPMLIRERETGS